MKRAAPLRFLALVAGGWICVRAAILVPDWWEAQGAAEAPSARPAPVAARFPPGAEQAPAVQEASIDQDPSVPMLRSTYNGRFSRPAPPFPGSPSPPFAFAPQPLSSDVPELPVGISAPGEASPLALPPPAFTAARRWSGSAWILLRRDRGGAALAPGGTLGGSQAGARLLYRLSGEAARPLALSARLYAPLRGIAGAEAAAGLDWRPSARIPVHILAERRQALGRDGRSAFALTLYGGVGSVLPHGLRFDAYGQGGIVGTRSRDLFIDAAARLSLPVGPVEAGAAAWGAAQPGAARLDMGPSISWRLPVAHANLRLSADWRFRVAGDAAPGPGPALTLAADF